MKNPTTFITKDGVSDTDLIQAARDMYEALESIELDLRYAEGRIANKIQRHVRTVLAKARGES
jgi:hypothetical protein